MPDIRSVDVHAHAIPRAMLTEIERRGDRYGGMSVAASEAGPVVSLPGGGKVRPLDGKLLDFDQRVTWLEERGVATQLVSPWTDLQGFELAPLAGAEWAHVLNDALAEACGSSNGRLVALGTVPFGDTPAGVRELDHLSRELHMPAVMISTNPGETSLADPALDDLWSAAEELGSVFILHPPSFGPAARIGDAGEFGNLWFRLVDTTLVVSRMILAGVLDRHPRLKIVLVHGGGFLPFQTGRFDRSYAIGGHATSSLSAGAPSEYLRRFYYDTCVMSPAAIRLLAEAAGPDRVLLGSDYPFAIGDPDPIGSVRKANLGDTTIAQILADNPAALFGEL